MGIDPAQTAQFVGRVRHDGTFDPLINHGGPVARAHSVSELGVPCALPAGVPPEADVVSLRNAMTLRGDGLLDDVAPGDLLANMANEPPDVRGRPNILPDGRIGKFGWKANVATLVEFLGDAFRNEMGVTNPLQPRDEIGGCGANRNHPDVDALALDMGPALADRTQQASAQGNEWRTMPLWRAAERGRFLHDGRASTLTEAIGAHGGQAQHARDGFLALSEPDKQTLLAFLNGI
jgi:CxxC motif-containing protein (DUF1111 family)